MLLAGVADGLLPNVECLDCRDRSDREGYLFLRNDDDRPCPEHPKDLSRGRILMNKLAYEMTNNSLDDD